MLNMFMLWLDVIRSVVCFENLFNSNLNKFIFNSSLFEIYFEFILNLFCIYFKMSCLIDNNQS